MMELKRVQFVMDGEKPTQFGEPIDTIVVTEEHERVLRQVSDTLAAYLRAAEKLAAEKYAGVRELLPPYFTAPGVTIVSCAKDGICIRHERRKDKLQIGVCWHDEPLADVVSMMSQRVIRCIPPGTIAAVSETDGVSISLNTYNPTSGLSKTHFTQRIFVDAVLEAPLSPPKPPERPFRLTCVTTEITLTVYAAYIDEETQKTDPFILRSLVRLPVGWDCIEVFPGLNLDLWKPENAPFWAEMDILARVASQQQNNAQFESLDPCAAARHQFAVKLQQFKVLLDSNPEREETLQTHLKENGWLVCLSYKKMWPKVPLGKHVTDFVFQDALGGYLLVEIERSTLQLFNKNGDPSGPLNHAISQINDWRRYIEDNLSTVQNELGLTGISSSAQAVIIIGRSAALTESNRRKLRVMDNQSPRLKIMTYDDVYTNAEALLKNMFGPLHINTPQTRVYNWPEGSLEKVQEGNTPINAQ